MTSSAIEATSWAYKNWQSSSTEISDTANLYVGTENSENYYTRLQFPSFWESIKTNYYAKNYRITDIKLYLYSNSGLRFNTYTYCKQNASWDLNDEGDFIIPTAIGDAGSDEIWDGYQDLTALGQTILNYNSNFYIYIRPKILPASDRVQIKTKNAGTDYKSLHPRLVYTYEENSNYIYKNGIWQPILEIKKYENGSWKTISSIKKY